MATNEQVRRGRGAANESARRATGASNTTARKGIEGTVKARRTGASTVDDINSLIRQPAATRSLPTLEARGSVPAQKGVGTWEPPTRPTGGGIASPLTETDYAARQYWPEQTLVSVDGLLSFRIKPLKQIVQADAADAEVVQEFAQPPVQPPPVTP